MPTSTQPALVHSLGFRAMNCEMGAWVVAPEAEPAHQHLVAVRDFIWDAEAQFSRFRPESDLSRLNARSGEAVQASPVLWDVIVWALDAGRRTGGLYDPTILDGLEAAGYDRSFEEIVDASDDGQPLKPMAQPTARWHDVRLEPATRRVTLPPGIRLDLGGVAKGWTADRAIDQLSVLGPAMIDVGGDIVVRGRPPGQAGWPIGIADPHDPESDLALLIVSDRGIATSGVDYRRWRRGGTVQHHIIDPRTRRPAQTDLLSVTVIAPDAAQADLHALMALLLGGEDGRRYLERQAEVEGLLVQDDGRLSSTPGFEQYTFHTARDW